jgi:hypothetical protein
MISVQNAKSEAHSLFRHAQILIQQGYLPHEVVFNILNTLKPLKEDSEFLRGDGKDARLLQECADQARLFREHVRKEFMLLVRTKKAELSSPPDRRKPFRRGEITSAPV